MYKQCFNNTFILNIEELCPNSCSNNGECRKSVGCMCKYGFTSHDCSEKVKCKDNCNNNGVCHTNARCGCFPGWSGVVCNNLINCDKNCTSFENGVCQIDGSCKCRPGFTGADCGDLTIIGNDKEADVDAYKILSTIHSEKIAENNKKMKDKKKLKCPNDCSGHGVCKHSTGKCHCEDSYTGDDCSVQVDPTTLIQRTTLKTRVDPKSKDEDTPDSATASKDAEKDNDEDDEKAEPTTIIKKSDKENVKSYKVGKTNEIIYQTTGCPNDCSTKGLCLNSACFCDQGYTTEDCSMTYKQYNEQGFKLQDVSSLFLIAFGGGLIITLISLLLSRSQKVSSDHIMFEENQ